MQHMYNWDFWGMHLFWWVIWIVLLIWIFATPWGRSRSADKKRYSPGHT